MKLLCCERKRALGIAQTFLRSSHSHHREIFSPKGSLWILCEPIPTGRILPWRSVKIGLSAVIHQEIGGSWEGREEGGRLTEKLSEKVQKHQNTEDNLVVTQTDRSAIGFEERG